MPVRLSHFSAIFLRILKESSWLASLLILGIIFGSSAIFFSGLPSLDNIRDLPRNRTSILYDRTGTQELYRLYGEENRIILPHDQIPDVVRHATLAAEDRNFFSHPGVDAPSLFRALIKNLQSGSIRQGGSTITQQVARALYLTREKTFSRKLKEAVLALKIERILDKDEILDLYLNTVPYGANAYGLQFHPEVTREMMCLWTVRGAHNLSKRGAQPGEAHLEGWGRYDAAVCRWLDGFLDVWLAAEDERARRLPVAQD